MQNIELSTMRAVDPAAGGYPGRYGGYLASGQRACAGFHPTDWESLLLQVREIRCESRIFRCGNFADAAACRVHRLQSLTSLRGMGQTNTILLAGVISLPRN